MRTPVDAVPAEKSTTLLTKASTASRWLAALGDVPPPGVLAEYPLWMQNAIRKRLREQMAKDYWRKINDTTRHDIERFLADGITEGESIRTMAGKITEEFPGSYSRARATNVARTESTDALNAARSESISHLKDELGEVGQYVVRTWLSVLGTTTRDAHADLDGVPEDAEGGWVLNGVWIPWPGHSDLEPGDRCNCFPSGVLVQGDFVGAQRGRYDGVFSEIVLRFGGRIAMTPNQPVVTSEGLVPAGQIRPGQKVMTYHTEIDRAPFVAPGGDQVENKPVPIQELFEAHRAAAGGVELRAHSVDDFYGDGKSLEGNIDIVRPGWSLLNDGEFGQFEKRGDLVLLLPPGAGRLVQEFGAGAGGLGGGCVDSSAAGLPRLSEPPLNVLLGRVTPTGTLAVGVAADFDSRLDESSRQDGPSVTGFLRDALERYAGTVAFDEVAEVRDFQAVGHVYDLQSRYGLIVAHDPRYCNIGIVTANCQCTVATDFIQDDERQELLGEYDARVAERESE